MKSCRGELMDNRRRRDLDTSSGFGVGVQRFPSALPSSSSLLDNLETRCTELFCLAKINQVPTLGYSEDLGLIDRSLFLERHTSSANILSAIPLRLDGGQEVSSISEVNIEPQSAQKTSDNYINSHMGLESPSVGRTFQNWADNHSSKGETSTSMEGEAKEDDHRFENGNYGDTVAASWSLDHGKAMPVDSKVLRRLAQNREAARKSRLRKKAYVQQLESSRVKMNQLEQELERIRQQGMFLNGTGAGEHNHPGVVAFDTDYAKWVEEQNRQLCDLRSALAVHIGDSDLRLMVDNATSHYDELFRLKGVAVKADVFHIMSGMWRTPAERCFMWMGGLRPSELLKRSSMRHMSEGPHRIGKTTRSRQFIKGKIGILLLITGVLSLFTALLDELRALAEEKRKRAKRQASFRLERNMIDRLVSLRAIMDESQRLGKSLY